MKIKKIKNYKFARFILQKTAKTLLMAHLTPIIALHCTNNGQKKCFRFCDNFWPTLVLGVLLASLILCPPSQFILLPVLPIFLSVLFLFDGLWDYKTKDSVFDLLYTFLTGLFGHSRISSNHRKLSSGVESKGHKFRDW